MSSATYGAACRKPPLPLLALPLPFVLSPVLQELLLSYNIGIPIDLREKDMNTRAANLVGLQMPAKEKT